MTEEPQNGRISVSEDRLRGVIAEFELRLRDFLEDKLVHKADLAMLTQLRKDFMTLSNRVDAELAEANGEHDKLCDRVNVLEKWRYGLGVLAAVALAVAGVAANHI